MREHPVDYAIVDLYFDYDWQGLLYSLILGLSNDETYIVDCDGVFEPLTFEDLMQALATKFAKWQRKGYFYDSAENTSVDLQRSWTVLH